MNEWVLYYREKITGSYWATGYYKKFFLQDVITEAKKSTSFLKEKYAIIIGGEDKLTYLAHFRAENLNGSFSDAVEKRIIYLINNESDNINALEYWRSKFK